MKKKILLFSLIAGMGYLGLSSYQAGPAANNQNCTGAKASPTNCSNSGTCHGGTAASTVATIRVDSVGGVAVSKYVAGMTYTVTVTGSSTVNSKFGFQYTAVSGSGASQIKAGSIGTTLPSMVAKHTFSSLDFVEQTTAITGSGTPSSFSKQFTWTAPTTAVGDITMYLTVNAVNGNGTDDGSDLSGNVLKTLPVYVPPTSSIAAVTGNFSLKAFPNPASSNLNLQVAEAGTYNISVYDMNGKHISSQTVNIADPAQAANINTANFASGMYILSIEKDGNRQVTSFAKQ